MNKTALKRTVEAALCKELAEQWDLPMEQYKAAVECEPLEEPCIPATLHCTFTHRTTKATIACNGIITDRETGDILQSDRYELKLRGK